MSVIRFLSIYVTHTQGTVEAQLSHEKKYVDMFRRIYPTSTIVLIKITTAWLYSSQTGRVSPWCRWASFQVTHLLPRKQCSNLSLIF